MLNLQQVLDRYTDNHPWSEVRHSTVVCVDGLLSAIFERNVMLAGLTFLQIWGVYVVWKVGTVDGWIVKIEDRRTKWDSSIPCYCDDCFTFNSYHWKTDLKELPVISQLKNIGLKSIAVGEEYWWLDTPDDFMRDYQRMHLRSLNEEGFLTVELEESPVYKAFKEVRLATDIGDTLEERFFLYKLHEHCS